MEGQFLQTATQDQLETALMELGLRWSNDESLMSDPWNQQQYESLRIALKARFNQAYVLAKPGNLYFIWLEMD